MRLSATLLVTLFFIAVSHNAHSQKGWVAVDEPFPNLNWLDVDFLDNDFGFVVGEQGRIKRTTNGGAEWEFRQSGATEIFNAVHVVNRNLIFAAGHSSTLVKSTNGGDSWETVPVSGDPETLLDVHFFDEMEGFICGAKSLLMKTTDGGATWENQNSRFNNNNVWEIHAFDRKNLIICGNAGNISRTTNGGESWRSQTTPFPFEIYSISFADTLNGLCVGVNASIMKTTDGGKEWKIHDPGFPLPTLPFNGVAMPEVDYAYACGWNAMIVGMQPGIGWEVQDVPDGYSGTHLTGISFPSPEVGYISGWDGTILKTVNGGTLPVEQIETASDDFTLAEFYPNPVTRTGSANTAFSIPARTGVTITVYNMYGQKVAVPVEGPYDRGTYSLDIPVGDFPEGVYIVRMNTADGQLTRKLIVDR